MSVRLCCFSCASNCAIALPATRVPALCAVVKALNAVLKRRSIAGLHDFLPVRFLSWTSEILMLQPAFTLATGVARWLLLEQCSIVNRMLCTSR